MISLRRIAVSRLDAAGLVAYLGVVAAATGVASLGLVSSAWLASSPDRIAASKFWFLFTNGLVCDKPVAASLVGVALFGFFALAVCGRRVLWTAGVLGHVFSTLFVYALIASARLVDPGAFDRALSAHDQGVSAVCAAWLGAAAATLWRRPESSTARRAAIAGCCLLVGALAWVVNPDLTVLDADHLFAFPIGAAVATVPLRSLVHADSVFGACASAANWARVEVVAFLRSLRSRAGRSAA